MALQNIGGASTKSGISRLTTEFLYWNIVSGNEFPSASAEVAIIPTGSGKPTAGDWDEAEIVPTPGNATQYSVRALVGPNTDIDLTPASVQEQAYSVWIRITSGVERIVRSAGTLTVR